MQADAGIWSVEVAFLGFTRFEVLISATQLAMDYDFKISLKLRTVKVYRPAASGDLALGGLNRTLKRFRLLDKIRH
jgi:hypothetical protein